MTRTPRRSLAVTLPAALLLLLSPLRPALAQAAPADPERSSVVVEAPAAVSPAASPGPTAVLPTPAQTGAALEGAPASPATVQLERRFRAARTRKEWGIGLSMLGGVLTLGGLSAFGIIAGKAGDSDISSTAIGAVVGLPIATAGLISGITGLALWSTGAGRMEQAVRQGAGGTEDDRITGRKLRLSGAILTSIGVVGTVLGAVLTDRGTSGSYYNQAERDREAIAGFTLLGVGPAALATGASLWVIGHQRLTEPEKRVQLSLGGAPAGSLGTGLMLRW
jgi:hypothetical protein